MATMRKRLVYTSALAAIGFLVFGRFRGNVSLEKFAPADAIFLQDTVWNWSGGQLHSNRSIPKIIHQTFRSEMVYGNYRPLIRRCLELNPDWKYYLWRDSDAVALIRDKYPQFLGRYAKYRHNLERSDSIRYIVLHQFGGIYLDMDVECVRPFYPALSHLPAFLDQERREQTNIVWSRPYSAMNSVMGSLPGHEFFGRMINAMLGVRWSGNAMETTGPGLLTRHHARYLAAAAAEAAAAGNSKHRLRPLSPVFLMPPSAFSPMMDGEKNWRMLCRELLSRRSAAVASWKTIGCRALASNRWRLDARDASTIGIHRFLHLGYPSSRDRRQSSFNISREFPSRVHFYESSASAGRK